MKIEAKFVLEPSDPNKLAHQAIATISAIVNTGRKDQFQSVLPTVRQSLALLPEGSDTRTKLEGTLTEIRARATQKGW